MEARFSKCKYCKVYDNDDSNPNKKIVCRLHHRVVHCAKHFSDYLVASWLECAECSDYYTKQKYHKSEQKTYNSNKFRKNEFHDTKEVYINGKLMKRYVNGVLVYNAED